MALVTAGAGVHFSVASSFGCLKSSGVRLLRLTGEAPRLEIGLMWRRDDASPPLRRFLEAAQAGAVRPRKLKTENSVPLPSLS